MFSISIFPLSAFIGSILNFTILIFGFIAGNTFERFGARALMVTGGSVAFAGYVASAFAPSVVFLYFREERSILLLNFAILNELSPFNLKTWKL